MAVALVQDYPTFDDRRHLLRLWLTPADERPLPKVSGHRGMDA